MLLQPLVQPLQITLGWATTARLRATCLSAWQVRVQGELPALYHVVLACKVHLIMHAYNRSMHLAQGPHSADNSKARHSTSGVEFWH